MKTLVEARRGSGRPGPARQGTQGKDATPDKRVLTELSRIEKRDGALTTGAVVRAAQVKSSALHSFFEWDDSEAAQRYRIWQARQLITTYTVIVKDRDDRPVEAKAFYSIRVAENGPDEEESRAYFSAARIQSNPQLAAAVIADARQGLFSWKKRYAIVRRAFEPVFGEIERLEDERSA